MYCKHCGNPIDDNTVFCPNCGTATAQPNTNGVVETEPVNNASPTNPPACAPFCAFAIVGFVLSCVTMFIDFWGIASLVSCIISIIALVLIKRNGLRGKGLAIAGTIIGIVFAALHFSAALLFTIYFDEIMAFLSSILGQYKQNLPQQILPYI